jgi:carbon monoxide dehydrogenase subunit G
MPKVERTITINAPIDKVFAYITNPTNEKEFVPSITDIRNIKGEGVGQTYEWTFKMMGIPRSGKSETMEYKPNERYVTKSSGGIVSTWAYTFKSEAGGTQVNLVIDYSIPIPVLGKFGERLALRGIEREADYGTAALKDILEG